MQDSIFQENSRCSGFPRHYGPNLRRVYGTPTFPNPHMRRIQNGCAIIWIFVRRTMFSRRSKRVCHTFSTHDRKSSKPRRNSSRRHTQSRCMTSLCASGIPAPMSRRSQTSLRSRLSLSCRLVLARDPVNQAPPQKPALPRSPPINRLLTPSLPPTTRTLPQEFPGSPSTPGWPMTSGAGTTLRKPCKPIESECGTFEP
jgi:hypothetical protein